MPDGLPPPRSFGAMNPNVVGSLMKEAVRRAIVAIRAERFSFEARVKGSTMGGSPDMVTSADHAAQRVYIKLLREWFPDFGIVAEEDQLRVPCTLPGADLWFTVDPLDGTKAFIRRQSHGVGTMIALVQGDRVIAACVGDVMTQEVYAWRPGGAKVHRISEFGIAETLRIPPDRPLFAQWLLLRDMPADYSPDVRALVARPGGAFGGYEIMNGSVGTMVARLWKGEMGGAIIRPGPMTPWDLCPLIGLSEALDFVFLQARDGDLVETRMPVAPMPTPLFFETLVVHRSRLAELRAWWAAGTWRTA